MGGAIATGGLLALGGSAGAIATGGLLGVGGSGGVIATGGLGFAGSGGGPSMCGWAGGGVGSTAAQAGAGGASGRDRSVDAGDCPPRSNGAGVPFWAAWKMPNPADSGLPNPASYTDLGDGTVRDNITGLVWQRHVDGNATNWPPARDYCAGLTLAGGGWRMASRIELVSLFDFTKLRDPASLPVDTTAASLGGSGFTSWASSPAAGYSSVYWYVDIIQGSAWTISGGGDAFRGVVCVRGPADTQVCDYVPVSPGELQDPQTGLIWQQVLSNCRTSWSDAQSYCAAFGLNGHTWRVPGMKELQTLVDESRASPAIDTSAFPDTPSEGFWTSSRLAGSSSKAWYVDFTRGNGGQSDLAEGHWMRCVR